MIEIRWHGRGGQGAITAAQILAEAASMYEDKWVTASPSFGAERRGAPVIASTRISNSKIRIRSQIENPDIVIVLDPTLVKDVDITAGLKDDGIIIINSPKAPEEYKFSKKYKVFTCDCTKIALDLQLLAAGQVVLNTPILGSLIKAKELVKIENVKVVIQEHFPKDGGKNANAAQQAYEHTMGGS
ncbi:MAG: pyruvate ferredoxin oxidoreductase [Candidatus Lokiarchaeota archaeon]|nr:pyruvate ferredoxin oxidoreductase [Candidatus Lokiarchaeota archaeon]